MEELHELARRHDIPRLLLEIEDERTRFRLREALYVSVILHFLLVGITAALPRMMPQPVQIVEVTPDQMLRDREMTYLELPPALRQVKPPPDTKFMSDQDRIASTRAPQLDKRQLDQVLDSTPGSPVVGNRGSGNSPQPPQPAPPAGGQQQASQGPPPPRASSEFARAATPPAGRGGADAFRTPVSAGTAIQEAARASMGTAGGDVPGGPVSPSGEKVRSDLEILSNTMGVNFAPYLQRVLHEVRRNWYTLIPEVARAPLMKRGKVSIEFAIMKDGSVAGLKVADPSGDISLDRAAYGGITASTPFPPLPGEFGGEYLALRFHFYYNPDRTELR
jgi:TonB family protein